MRFTVRVDSDLPKWTVQQVRRGEVAVTQGVAEVGRAVQQAWRGQVGSVLGRRLAGTIRLKVYPDGQPSPDAAALIWTKAPDIIGAHEKGALIRSSDGFYLAIPTDAAGRGARGARLSPAEWEARRGIKLRFVFRRGRPALLVADNARVNSRGFGVASRSKTGRGVATVPIFVLVPQVRLAKRLDLKGAAQSNGARLPAAIRAAFARGGKQG